MKYLTCVLLNFISINSNGQKSTENLRGKVSRVTSIYEDTSHIGNSYMSYRDKTVKDFDLHGNLVKMVKIYFYDSDEKSTSDTVTEILKYEKNQLVERTLYVSGNAPHSHFNDNKWERRSCWVYDSINSGIQTTTIDYFNALDTLNYITTINFVNLNNEITNSNLIIGKDTVPIICDVIFNSKGQKIQETYGWSGTSLYYYNSLGHLIKRQDSNGLMVFERNKEGLVLNEKFYMDGSCSFHHVSFKYDTKKNVLEEEGQLENKIFKTIHKYQYDSHGNYILKKSEYWSDANQYMQFKLEKVTIEKREIKYYD